MFSRLPRWNDSSQNASLPNAAIDDIIDEDVSVNEDSRSDDAFPSAEYENRFEFDMFSSESEQNSSGIACTNSLQDIAPSLLSKLANSANILPMQVIPLIQTSMISLSAATDSEPLISETTSLAPASGSSPTTTVVNPVLFLIRLIDNLT